jgi:hypothetical protein
VNAAQAITPTGDALSPELLRGLVERAGRPDFPAFEAQLRSSGNCARPIRLRGTIETCDKDGHRRVWSTEDEPDGVLRKACGNRREAVCPPCAERYRQDAYHLINAGLKGGKGVPATIAEHPAVFVTLTAPSFGAVHSRVLRPDGQPLRCRARRDAPVCEHGRPLSCGAVHGEGDRCLGEPLCEDCWDYAGAVTWNNTLGALWRYTTIYLPRALARLTEMTQTRLKRQVRPAYVKVAEYQQRGLVHLHVLVRLDRAMCKYRAHELHPPPARFDAELLEQAVRETVADVNAPAADALGGERVRWGRMLDVRQLATGEQRGEIAGYLAKYATKSTEQAGGLLHRISPDGVPRVKVREHVRTFMSSAFVLDAIATSHRQRTTPRSAGQPAGDVETDWHTAALVLSAQRAMTTNEPVRLRMHDDSAHTGRIARLCDGAPARDGTTVAVELDSGTCVHLADVVTIGPVRRQGPGPDRRDPRLAECAHAFGYRGHCLTKSRRYSTTFKQLRVDREAWVHQQILARSRDATQRALAEAEQRTVMLEVDGVGHVTASDERYALEEHARARERRRIGREECCDQAPRATRARRRATAGAPTGRETQDREAMHDE